MSSKYTKQVEKINKELKTELKKNNKRVSGIIPIDCLCNERRLFYGVVHELCLRAVQFT